MEFRGNVWTVLGVAVALAFAWATMQFLIPAAAAQIGANQGLIAEVNRVLEEEKKARDTWQTKVETRLEGLEEREVLREGQKE